jgi:predicted dehydrogenase
MIMPKIGILSFAHMHAHSYATCLNELSEANFCAIWDDNPKRGKEMAKLYGTNFIKSLDSFLQSGLDGVIICSENVHHRFHVEAAAKAGLWILCEKPLATDTTDAKAMIAACKKAGVGLGTAFPCRFVTTLKEVRDQVQSGRLGTLLVAACTNNGSFPGGWFAEKELSGGGAVMDHTVHVADAIRWITGQEFTKVYCDHGNTINKNIGMEDVGSLHLEMDGGLKVSHVASWNRAFSFPTWGDVTMELVGTKGSITVDAFNQKVDVYSNSIGKAEWASWGDNADLGLVADFVDAVVRRRTPAVSGEDGLRAVEVTMAAYQSAKDGLKIRI